MEDILITEASQDYELLDSGDGEKLERYKNILIVRPEAQALWPKSLSLEKWQEALARFESSKTGGRWIQQKELPENWAVALAGITLSLKPTPFRHVGVFPEQSAQWKWLQEKASAVKSEGRDVSVLNLFAYSGGASLACAKAGARVVHVDASEFAVDWAMKNRDVSGLSQAPIRFIVDDVRKFLEREIKRGSTYDMVLLDPPVYGKGAKNETWKLEQDLQPLLQRIPEVLSSKPLAILLNGYASEYSHLTYANMLKSAIAKKTGTVTSGETAIRESSSEKLLSCGIFALWQP